MRILADLARETGVSAYSGDGTNQWPSVHVSDAGRLYRLALEAKESARAYHASAENVPFRAIAEAIGRALGLPVRIAPARALRVARGLRFCGLTDVDDAHARAHGLGSDRPDLARGPLGFRVLREMSRPSKRARALSTSGK